MSNTNPPSVPGFSVDDNPPPPGKPTRITKSNSTTVTLRGVSVPLNSDVGGAFITDLSRNKERLFSDQQVIEKYDITPDDWTKITQSKAIRLAVNAEHERRMLRGISAQEAAAKIFTEAPEVLGSILRDNKASPKHRIDASRELRATANIGAEKSDADIDRVIINIDLGGDSKLILNKQVAPIRTDEEKEQLDAD